MHISKITMAVVADTQKSDKILGDQLPFQKNKLAFLANFKIITRRNSQLPIVSKNGYSFIGTVHK